MSSDITFHWLITENQEVWMNQSETDIIHILKSCYKNRMCDQVKVKHITNCSDPWVLGFVVSNTTCKNQWENCTSFDFYFHGLSTSRPRNQRKLEPHD
jgi:hypothetical protein